MKKTTPISLRPLLIKASVKFLKQEKMGCLTTQEGLPELINHLLYYKEEGRPLFPEIYIFDSIDLIRKVLINFQSCSIGNGPKTTETMIKALKKCAPMTGNGWMIYILRKKTAFDYGVFRAGTSIISVTITETLLDDEANKLNAIVIRQVAEKLIEVKGVKANTLLINYGNYEDIENSPTSNQHKFIETIVTNVDTKFKEPVTNFFRATFLEVLQKGHGALACTINYKTKSIAKKLIDGIELSERINVLDTIAELLSKNDLLANSKLEGLYSLIIGMLNSDGITIFTDKGELVAFNVFIKHSKKVIKTITNGGARMRTYLTLNEMIGKEIKSAYIQSQDGKIEYKNGK